MVTEWKEATTPSGHNHQNLHGCYYHLRVKVQVSVPSPIPPSPCSLSIPCVFYTKTGATDAKMHVLGVCTPSKGLEIASAIAVSTASWYFVVFRSLPSIQFNLVSIKKGGWEGDCSTSRKEDGTGRRRREESSTTQNRRRRRKATPHTEEENGSTSPKEEGTQLPFGVELPSHPRSSGWCCFAPSFCGLVSLSPSPFVGHAALPSLSSSGAAFTCSLWEVQCVFWTGLLT